MVEDLTVAVAISIEKLGSAIVIGRAGVVASVNRPHAASLLGKPEYQDRFIFLQVTACQR